MLSEQRQSIVRFAVGAHADDAIKHLNLNEDGTQGTPAALAPAMDAATLQRAKLAESVAKLADDNFEIATNVLANPEIQTTRDIALKYNTEAIAYMVLDKSKSGSSQATLEVKNAVTPASDSSKSLPRSPGEELSHTATTSLHQAQLFQRRLFLQEPTAVLQRMVTDNEIPIHSSPEVRKSVAQFLDANGAVNVRRSSLMSKFKDPAMLQKIDDTTGDPKLRGEVVKSLRLLQTTQALTPTPEAIAPLMEKGMTSALRVSSMSEKKFVATMKPALAAVNPAEGDPGALALSINIFRHASQTRQSIDNALLQIYQTIKGTGLAAIDGLDNVDTRMQQFRQKIAADSDVAEINLETLFGGMDFCDCDSCGDITSPTAYFVELLQYLRNNNLDPDAKWTNTGKEGIARTALEQLFIRRPDIQHLELTCQNANTVLPYIDLSNEVMESFVAHLSTYRVNWTPTKQVELDVFDVEDEDTNELRAAPQHTNYTAYCILKNEICPIGSLPYFQPLDAIRIYLKFLQTSRYEIVDVFRRPDLAFINASQGDTSHLEQFYTPIEDRAASSEFLGLSIDEYVIITKESFWPKEYFEATQSGASIDDPTYQTSIGVRPPNEHWGYPSTTEMLSIDEFPEKLGLAWVKAQFLPRSGLTYVETVDLVKTKFINPMYPKGRDKVILESIRFSYRFLQSLVDNTVTDKHEKFALLVEFLFKAQPWVQMLLDAQDVEGKNSGDGGENATVSLSKKETRCWVYKWFDCVGKLIVLESGEGPELPTEGWLRLENSDKQAVVLKTNTIGYLHVNGEVRIEHNAGTLVATVAVNGQVFTPDRKLLSDQYKGKTIRLYYSEDAAPTNVKAVVKQRRRGVYIAADGYLAWDSWEGDQVDEPLVKWLPAVDTCNIDKVRLLRLNGDAVDLDDWDRMQRFIRLYRKLGWAINEIDQALIGLATPKPPTPTVVNTVLTFKDLKDTPCDTCGRLDCSWGSGGDGSQGSENCQCSDMCDSITWASITPDFIEQLMYIRKLGDLTSLELPQMLAFWTDIGTDGDNPLYTTLFLTHNLIALDPVFQPDGDGNYFTTSTKIGDHIPVILAALRIKTNDLTAILTSLSLDTSTELNLDSISNIYRFNLLAKTLGVPVPAFMAALTVFEAPFSNAEATRDFVDFWNRMTTAGFTSAQLLYIAKGTDDVKRPLAPQKTSVLRTAKTILDGLTSIMNQYPDLTSAAETTITSDQITTNTSVLYSSTITSQITGLIEGTQIHMVRAPAGLVLNIPAPLSAKISLTNQIVSVKGNLTDDERTAAKALSPLPGWSLALNSAAKQAVLFIKDNLADVFGDKLADAIAALTVGDVPATPPATETDVGVPGTAPAKRLYFIKAFLPYLRSQLADKLIVGTMQAVAGISSPDIVDALLRAILKVGSGSSPQSTLDALKEIQKDKSASTGTSSWQGYLTPLITDTYTFVAYGDTQPTPLLLNGVQIAFVHQEDDPFNIYAWSTDAIQLTGGQVYPLTTSGLKLPGDLMWKTPRDAVIAVPASSLVPDYSIGSTMDVFVMVQKAAIAINGFNLNASEVQYLQSKKGTADFSGFDFNAITLPAFRHILAYKELRDSLPSLDMTLVDLFKWASRSDSVPTDIPSKLNAVTNWDLPDLKEITALIGDQGFNMQQVSLYRNEVALLSLQRAQNVINKLQLMDPTLPFQWVNLLSHFSSTRKIAQQILANIRSRYSLNDYESAVKPLNDQLRRDQRDALIAYLLVQPELRKWGVIDADSLFEFFLIDVQMGACMTTSRIKQAISTVQTFVMRCILGLEEHKMYGVKNDALDQDRWKWMNKQTLWTANRKVFLYPENWLVSSLRDDKTQFYTELEGDLLQKDISPQNNVSAFKSYLTKLDQVGNLKAVGMYQETYTEDGTNKVRIHVVARTQTAPYFFFYRTYSVALTEWTSWMSVKVDIPVYEGTSAKGTHLIPMVWGQRIFIFTAEFAQQTSPNTAVTTKGTQFSALTSTSTAADLAPETFWQIKLGWSELRDGKWTQKVISTETISTPPVKPDSALALENFFFVQSLSAATGAGSIRIEAWHYENGGHYFGYFEFKGNALVVILHHPHKNNRPPSLPSPLPQLSFHYNIDQLHSLQRDTTGSMSIFDTSPYFSFSSGSISQANVAGLENFYDTQVHTLLDVASSATDLGPILNIFQKVDATDLTQMAATFGYSGTTGGFQTYNELSHPYSIYHWELGFHAPLELADALLNNQQFDSALDLMHLVFDPHANGDIGDARRAFLWQPFKGVSAEYVLEALFNSLKPHAPSTQQIEAWRDNPFAPHVVARGRPVAYMKWAVMKYISILIAYGDYYFRRNTLEDLPNAIQLYILASHVYGPKGQRIPKRGKKKVETYYSLLDKWDAFGNAVVEMELSFPFSNQSPQPVGIIDSGSNDSDQKSISTGTSFGLPDYAKNLVLANVFGFATTFYFCIPDNPQLRALRDTIDDRLYKIRNCMDIDGNVRSLSLWEPPLDVGQLVAAVAGGLSLSSVLNDLYSNLPNYRFMFLLGKANEVCGDLKGITAQFLSIKERRDSEALQLMKSGHEMAMNNLVMTLRKQQLAEAQKALDVAKMSRKPAEYRYWYYGSLAGASSAPITDDESEYQPFTLTIDAPTTEGDLHLSPNENSEMDESSRAQGMSEDSGHLETLAGVLHALPSFNIHMTPMGCGVEVAWGMPNLASAASAGARYIQVESSTHSFNSTNAGRKGGNIKQYQERIQQMNLAGHDIKHINSQIAAATLRIASANQEIVNQQKQIDNSAEADQFLRNKYTNDDLYAYLETTVRQLQHQYYTVAYDLAKKAEMAYRFERNAQDTNFINSGYYNPARDGLQSGEALQLALRQMEVAYQTDRGYDFEVQKSISIRQLNPLALLNLRQTGVCQFDIPEVLFDMDFPGHYYRKIKSVSVSLPCVVGPYTSVNCTLRLMTHQYRVSPSATSSKDYVQKTDGSQDDRFTTVRIPIDAIAVSTGQNDSGVFELSLKDERYLPFEGAGVISTWQLQLPSAIRQFDYDSISDVILSIRYTSSDGGDKLRKPAADSVADYIKSVDNLSDTQGLFALLDLKSEFASEWAKLGASVGNATTKGKLVMKNLTERLPMFTRGRDSMKIKATDVTLFTPMGLKLSDLSIDASYKAVGGDSGNDISFDSGPLVIGKLNAFKTPSGVDKVLGDWALSVDLKSVVKLEKIWVLVRYVVPPMS